MARYVDFEGESLWTESLGSPSDPAILLISGAGAHAHFWSDSFCEFFVRSGYFVIRYDHREVGLSYTTPSPYDIERLAQDAIEILNSYEISSAHIIGHSMGGYLAQLLGANFPTRVKSLTLIAAGPIGEPPKGLPPPNAEERLILQETWRAMLKNRPTDRFEESFEGYLGVWHRLNGKFPVDETMARHYTEELFTRSRYPAGVPDHQIKAMQEMAQKMKERTALFSRISAPILIIQGESDYLVTPARGGEALAACLPSADYQLIPNMGHMLFHPEVEQIVATTILTFYQM